MDITSMLSMKKVCALDSIDVFLAEHVWEHLSLAEGFKSKKDCYRFLKKGGRLRIAVPDGLHIDPCYIEHVRPGGSGSGASDHKLLYTYKILDKVLSEAGFTVDLLEYWDENGKFHYKEWDPELGKINRSCRFDGRNVNMPLSYTSLIADGIK